MCTDWSIKSVKFAPYFREFYTCFGTQTGVVRILVIFQDSLCSAISFKKFRRELSIDLAEHRYMLKNYQNTHYPHFSFIPKTGIAFPKTLKKVLCIHAFPGRFASYHYRLKLNSDFDIQASVLTT